MEDGRDGGIDEDNDEVDGDDDDNGVETVAAEEVVSPTVVFCAREQRSKFKPRKMRINIVHRSERTEIIMDVVVVVSVTTRHGMFSKL